MVFLISWDLVVVVFSSCDFVVVVFMITGSTTLHDLSIGQTFTFRQSFVVINLNHRQVAVPLSLNNFCFCQPCSKIPTPIAAMAKTLLAVAVVAVVMVMADVFQLPAIVLCHLPTIEYLLLPTVKYLLHHWPTTVCLVCLLWPTTSTRIQRWIPCFLISSSVQSMRR